MAQEEYALPLPVKRHFGQEVEFAQFNKIQEELHEAENAWREATQTGYGDKTLENQDIAHVNEEIADVITACITLLNMRGLDEKARGELFAKVNAKNRARGYLE